MRSERRFRELIDRSFLEKVSEDERQLIHDHIRDCDSCKQYHEVTARTILGLQAFTFTSEPDSIAQVRKILAHHTETMRQRKARFQKQTAFAAALLISIVGSVFVYQVAKLLTGPLHFNASQFQQGVVIFWLLPSVCSALSLLVTPNRNRGFS